ncbi:MAG: bifunctional UDP-N-acetylglucosamine diphosphorylase/glucosamine-1-phosphate N-acetyltransferase GlmU, partial [Clostridia bacterium]|nr:bifunctional UDP-N-acetylglucosamine diphosphorylase/glucosamine-1-phosphate N-acetyltransferase GlmU [Clostridia bacterium]
GAYWFKADALLGVLGEIGSENAQHEFYLTDAVTLIYQKGLRAGSFLSADPDIVLGANDRAQLLQLNGIARKRVLARLMEDGVSLIDDSGVIVGPDVKIGADTLLLPGTIVRGSTSIGSGCVIGPNSLIESCTIGDGVVFNASQAYRSRIDSGVTVGPFSHIRPDCVLHERVHVGDFVEIKNSGIGEGTKVSHLTYVGDSDIGAQVNFGCGCVTVNYDGVSKHRTKVCDHAFIGCNTNLVSPVEVGENAYTAAGTTVTRNVPDNALAVGRTRQENIEGWVTRKRQKKD